MSLMAHALQPHTLAGLISLGGRVPPSSLSDLLVAPGSSYDLDFDDIEQSISVDFRDSQTILPSLGSDCCRFATAAFQSIAPVSEEIVGKDTLAWSIVKLYYAAFYAGHSIIRIVGESCSFLERAHTSRLSSLGFAMGKTPSFRIDRGLYHCKLNAGATAVKYVKAAGASGGSHEMFWKIFEDRVHALAESILIGNLIPQEAQSVFMQFQSFEQILGAGPGRHGALSSVRNDLQYKHLFGVWFPVQLRKRDREKLGRLAAQWQRDPMDIDLQTTNQDVLSKFVIVCAFIVGLCRAMLLRIAEVSTEGAKCFACLGPISFLRDAGLQTTIKRISRA
jgi:hypothetical protein